MYHHRVMLIVGLVVATDAIANRAEAARQTLLPTQQRVRSVGKEVDLGLFPTGVVLSADGRLLVATNNGFLYQSLTAVDTQNLQTADRRIEVIKGVFLNTESNLRRNTCQRPCFFYNHQTVGFFHRVDH